MVISRGVLSGLILALIVSYLDAAAPPTIRGVDRNGDPLPHGAIARLGTTRLRGFGHRLAFTADNRYLIADRLWDTANGRAVPCMLDKVRRLETHLLPDGKAILAVTEENDHRFIERWRWGAKKPEHRVKVILDPDYLPMQRNWTFSGDGKVLLSFDLVLTKVRQWDPRTGQQIRRFDPLVIGGGFALRPDGKEVVLLSVAGGTHVYSTSTGKRLRSLDADDAKSAVGQPWYRHQVISPDGRFLVLFRIGELHHWDLRTGKRTILENQGEGPAGFSADSKWLAHADRRRIQLRDARTLKVLRSFEPHQQYWGGSGIAFSPDSKRIALSGAHCITLWDVATGKPLDRPTGHIVRVSSLAFSSDGRRIASGGGDGNVFVWDVASSRALHRFPGHLFGASGLAFSPDDKMLATGDGSAMETYCQRAQVRLFDLTSGKRLRQFQAHLGSVHTMRYSPDGKQLATAGGDERIRVWDVSSGKRLGQVRHLPECRPVAFLDGGKALLIHQMDGTFSRISTSSFELLGRFPPRANLYTSTNAQYLSHARPGKGQAVEVICLEQNIGFGSGSRIMRYDLIKGKARGAIFLPLPHFHRFHSSEVALTSSDAAVLALFGNGDPARINLWDTQRGKHFATFRGHQGYLTTAAFSPDGRRLATGSADTTILIWDVGMAYAEYVLPEVFPSEREVRRLADRPALVAEKIQEMLLKFAKAEQIARRLIQDLDADEFVVREKATVKLGKLGLAVAFPLRLALENKSVEIRARARRLLKALGKQAMAREFDPERIRLAVQILARFNGPEGLGTLEKLAKGDRATMAAQESQQALSRLRRSGSSR